MFVRARSTSRLLRAFLASIALIAIQPAAAQTNGPAWTRASEGYYLRFGVTWLSASQEFGRDGQRHTLFSDTVGFRDAKFGQTDVSFLCEYGVTDWLTAVAHTQLRTVVREAYFEPTARDTTISASGLTDLWLGARMRLLPVDSKYLATATLAWKAPMGSPSQEIPLGTGVADYSLGLAGATPYELGAVTGHFQLASDFRLRNRASNEITYLAQLDVNVGRGFFIQGAYDGVSSLADFDEGGASALNNSVVGDRSFGRWSVAVLLEVDEGLDLGASYSDHVFGRNALASTAFALTATWRGSGSGE